MAAATKKVPKVIRPQGRIYIRGTTLFISAHRDRFRLLTKPCPVTGETGSHYRRRRSQDRLGNQTANSFCTGSHRPPALWSGEGSRIIPSSHELLLIVPQSPGGVKRGAAMFFAEAQRGAHARSVAVSRSNRCFSQRRRRGARRVSGRTGAIGTAFQNANVMGRPPPARANGRPCGNAIRRCARPARPPPGS